MELKKINLLIISFISLTHVLLAQSTESIFKNVNSGISQHTITSIIQDHKGYLWVGTTYGLNKYDGISYKIYNNVAQENSNLSQHSISRIVKEKNGDLWIGTNGNGISRYDYNSDSFISYCNGPLNGAYIQCLNNRVNSDQLWIGTAKSGLIIYNKKTKDFEEFKVNQRGGSSISSNSIMTINRDIEGNIWIGTWGEGLNLFDKENGHFIHFKANGTNGLTSNIIRSSFFSKEGILYIGTNSGIKKLVHNEKGKYTFKSLLPEKHPYFKKLNTIRAISIIEDKNENIWIGTENEGLYSINKRSLIVNRFVSDENNPKSIVGNSVWTLFEDNTGIIWVGTFAQGLCKLDVNEVKFKKHYTFNGSKKGLSHNFISSFAEDSTGNIWIGTEGGGLNYFNTADKSFEQYMFNENNLKGISNNNVTDLVYSTNGNLWIATWSSGLCLKRKGQKHFERFIHDPNDSNSIANNDIFTIMEDSKKRIWISCHRKGISIYNTDSKSFKHISSKKNNIPSNDRIRAIYEDKKGNFWLGTDGSGIDRIKVDKDLNILDFENYNKVNSKNSESIYSVITCITEDNRGNVWVGTEGDGLLQFDSVTNSFNNIIVNNEFKDKAVYSIEFDDQNNLWVGSNQGLIKYNIENQIITNYDENDGLQSSEFIRSSSLKATNGSLYFGGPKGFNVFKPEEINPNPNKPEVYITSFQLNGSKTDSLDKLIWKEEELDSVDIHLQHDQNDFTLSVATLNYSQSQKNRIVYQLKNFDNKWIKGSGNEKITYSNVNYGKYTFVVKGFNNDGIGNKELKSLTIIIARPWYKTWWAYVIYSSMAVLLIVLIRQNTIRIERLRSQVKIEQLQHEQEKKLHQLKSRLFTNISHDLRTPLTLILTPLQTLYSETTSLDLKKQFGGMINNTERLLRLLNEILYLSRLESRTENLNYYFDDIGAFVQSVTFSFSNLSDKKSIYLKVSLPNESIMTYYDRNKLERIILNLLHNSFKFTDKFGEIELSLTKVDQKIKIVISDTGIGISEEEQIHIFSRFYQSSKYLKKESGSGIGLALVKELVEIQKGTIEVSSEPGKGTSFSIYLPYKPKLDKQENATVEDFNSNFRNEFIKNIEFETSNKGNEVKAKVNTEQDSYSHKPILLVVDDNSEIRNLLVQQFEQQFEILECDNGKSAFEVAKQQIPDIVISDIMMPKMNGYEFCEAMVKETRTSHIPIILLTAKASDENKIKGLNSGAIFYFTKPFNQKLLSLNVKNILEKREQIKKSILENKTLRLDPKSISKNDVDQEFMEKVMQCIEKNISNSDFQVQDLSDALSMSKIQLYRKLKGLINQSANEFIRSIRLKRAAQLLKQEQMTIAQITYEVGFSDLAYFRKCFKKQYGLNPSEYMKQLKESD